MKKLLKNKVFIVAISYIIGLLSTLAIFKVIIKFILS